jgi:hypothetical protein
MNPRTHNARTTSHSRGGDTPYDPLVDRLIEPVRHGYAMALRSLLWAVLLIPAVILGASAVAVVFGAVGGIAGAQTARAWRLVGLRPSLAVAGWGPVLVILLSVMGLGWAGAGLVLLVGAAVAVGFTAAGPGGVAVTAGATVRSALAPAVVGISMVQLADLGWAVAGLLVLLALGYDLACHVWSSDGVGPVVGRIVGTATVLVLTLAASAVHTMFELDPFGPVAAVWVFGALAAVLCPLGPMVASAMLPAARANAPALRRLDSLIVAAPLWMAAMWGYLS